MLCPQLRLNMLALLLYQQKRCEQLDEQPLMVVKGDYSAAEDQDQDDADARYIIQKH